MKPDRNGGGLNGWPMPPQIRRTLASIISARAKVMIRLSSGSLSYSRRISMRSTATPMKPTIDGREHDGGPAEGLVQREREVRAQREERAVREVHDAEQAEDDRQADGDQHVQAAEHEAARHLRQDDVEH